MTDKDFEDMVGRAIEKLPEANVQALDNVVIVVEDWPNQDQLAKGRVTHGTLFGLYEGIPRTARGNNYNMVVPDKITIFKGPLTRVAVNDDHLERLVSNTVWHEVAHHFGLGHDRIHQLERKAQVKQQFSDEVEYIQSTQISQSGARHGWFKRHGGVSQVPFYSLNTATGVGDRPEFVEENIRRAVTALNMDRDRLVHLQRLAHGNKVLKANAEHAGKIFDDYDAIITDTKDLPLALNTADCLSIFLHDPIKSAIGVVHAGWRGTKLEVAKSAVMAMVDKYGSDPSDIVAGFGPAIQAQNYIVDTEIADQFDQKYIKQVDGLYKLDFVAANLDQLKRLGLSKIEDSKVDTFADKEFFSFRRDRVTGRHLAVISL
jgi:YfiH family protein